MTLLALGNLVPQIDPAAWVAPNATVIGQVEAGPHVSIWFGATLRADNDAITIGAGSNIQEHAVLHTDRGVKLTIGRDVTIGHQAMLHGCTVGDNTLIGIQAVVLNHAVIGRNCLVGAGALVTEGKVFPDGSLIVGTPARVVRALTEAEIAGLAASAASYRAHLDHYRNHLRVVNEPPVDLPPEGVR